MRTLTFLLVLLLTACASAPHKSSVATIEVRQATPADIDAILAALSAPSPVVYTKYDTMEAAAIAALKEIDAKHGGAYEYGGVIGKNKEGKFTYSQATTDFQGDSVQLHNGLPPDAEAVAGYHTHPCIPEHEVEFFSPEDLTTVIYGHKPAAFMGDYCTGKVHEFKRGDQPDVLAVEHGTFWLTKGRIVGTFTTPHTLVDAT